MKLKQNVKINNLTPQLTLGLMVANGIYSKYGYEMVVTSMDDSRHGVNTLHGKGLAADLRTRDVKMGQLSQIVKELQESLPDFDIVLESDHIHLEYDPK